MATWRTTVRTTYLAPGGPGYMTFHYRNAPGLTPVEDLAAATDALEAAFTAGRSVFPSSTVFATDGVWQDIDGTSEVNVPGFTVPGTNTAGNVLPGNVSVCIGWRTQDRSRSGRGRTFLSGYLSTSSDNGTPAASVLSSANQIAQSLVNYNAGAGDGAFVVYSRTQNISRDITGFAVRDIFASLRSRRD